MSFSPELEKFEALFDQAVDATFANFFAGSPMQEMLRYHFATKGKRLRPQAVLFAAATIWQKNKKAMDLAQVVPFALAVELVHNGTLVHDDIQDGDEFRRGVPTLWKKYSMAQGINCGDALFFAAQKLILQGPYSEMVKNSLTAILADETFAVINGQSLEFHLKELLLHSPEKVTLATYEEMVRGKTSALFVMPYVGGAIMAGASAAEIKEITQLATSLGVVFQIQDDYIDLWGNKGRDQVGSDIAEGKLSYPVVVALTGKSAKKDQLREVVLKPREQTTSAEIAWAIAELESSGVKSFAAEEMERHLSGIESSKEFAVAFQPITARLRAAFKV